MKVYLIKPVSVSKRQLVDGNVNNCLPIKARAKVYFARMLLCSLKNALQYSLAKCSSKKMVFMKRAFNEESILTKNIGEHF